MSNLKQKQAWLKLCAEPRRLQFRGSGVSRCGPGPREVGFTDGTATEADVIIACTGYELGFPFLQSSVLDPVMVQWEVPTAAGRAGESGGGDPPTKVRARAP